MPAAPAIHGDELPMRAARRREARLWLATALLVTAALGLWIAVVATAA